jgi:hypothetical protein
MREERKEVPHDTYVTKSLDWEKIFDDFEQWLNETNGKEKRIDRYLKSLGHMFFTLGTAGGYVLAYIGYYLYKFVQSVDMDSYKVEVEHKVYKDGEQRNQ